MDDNFNSGVAFVLEAATEKVFYAQFLAFFCESSPQHSLQKLDATEYGDIVFSITNNETQVVTLIKFYAVGTISQIQNAGSWVLSRCVKKHPALTWTVFLCYDTDSHENNITKFHEGDWAELRKQLHSPKIETIIDLAASADIEDIMLLDLDSIANFLGLPNLTRPTGKKGKAIMKKIFRNVGPGIAYHEGERAEDLIKALDFNVIIEKSPIHFAAIAEHCLK